MQPEQQPVIRTNPLPHHIRHLLEPQGAHERRRFARRQPPGHDDGRAGDLTRKNGQRLLKSLRKLDEPDRMDFRRVLRQQQFLLTVRFRFLGRGRRGRFAGGFRGRSALSGVRGAVRCARCAVP